MKVYDLRFGSIWPSVGSRLHLQTTQRRVVLHGSFRAGEPKRTVVSQPWSHDRDLVTDYSNCCDTNCLQIFSCLKIIGSVVQIFACVYINLGEIGPVAQKCRNLDNYSSDFKFLWLWWPSKVSLSSNCIRIIHMGYGVTLREIATMHVSIYKYILSLLWNKIINFYQWANKNLIHCNEVIINKTFYF